MAKNDGKGDRRWTLVRVLAAVAALNCAVVPLFFAGQRPLFPLPGLYLIEIAALGILGLTALLLVEPPTPFWRAVPWVAAGALLAFVLLGGFSIGLFLIPAAVGFFAAAYLTNRLAGDPVSRRVGLFLIAAILQAALMVLLTPIV